MEEQFRDLFKIEGNSKKVNIGDILIAEPFVEEQCFSRTVVYIVEHNEKGTIGFILNKSLPCTVSDILTELPHVKQKVYAGGPMDENQLFYIHRHWELSNVLHIRNDIYWGGDFAELKWLLDGDIILSNDVRFFVGYCSWEVGQLEQELENNEWMVGQMTSAEFFRTPEEEMWSVCMNGLGGRYEIWAKFPVDPQWN